MKVPIGFTAALMLALTSSVAVAAPDDILKIPIKTVNGPVRASTLGRWRHTLRKYGLSQKKSSEGAGAGAGGKPRGHQFDLVETETNLARIPLVDYDFDREYYGTVMVGQPPQAFKIDFDTGSSQFIISAKDCMECSGTTHYDATASKTFKANGKPWKITYGDQSHAGGFLGRDMITLDGIRVKNQQLALVTNESEGFDDTIDGIMGLAFGTLSTSIASTKTVFENMMAQNLVERGIFSFYLGKSNLQGGGEVIFGGLDMSRVEPGHKITYTPVTRAKYWQINVSNVFVNGKSILVGNNGNNGNGKRSDIAGIMDTGTTLMVLPEKLAHDIHQRIRGAKVMDPSYTVPCNLANQDPEGRVELEIEGERFGVPFEDLVREETEDPGTCYSGIQTSSADFIIIGDVFIKNNYVVFDQENKRVGLAPLKFEARQVEHQVLNQEQQRGKADREQTEHQREHTDIDEDEDVYDDNGDKHDDADVNIKRKGKRWEVIEEVSPEHAGSRDKQSKVNRGSSLKKTKKQ
ncbi:hypothetical protein BGX28_007572 [Mortierella sp. GBA30]|nr:hypothetical protein BGX28_007572 [Mortierella sp. GBA30]